ncbi:hypothetical protein HAP41_0000043205 [Bradyrhizobium barranii subsp. apii]|uniref:Uncharacterized protein n=1 Tax=Bradyrhizobium barranii subsp. apii TaxID=2819348 RepID=A0A8T5UYB9_9BRAD|nr:hypothetical protein [Bradyrhizobium barranii]UPT86956.1 hypothetical protein HAP41_0000043205 [Bradyrhizobium barranii subsp. apii]
MNGLKDVVILKSDGSDIPSQQVLDDDHHSVKASADAKTSDIILEFSSRLALYEFAKSLLHEAVFGSTGQKEFYPLISNGKPLVVEGARLTEDSSRVFAFYPRD